MSKKVIERFSDMRGLVSHDQDECGTCCYRKIHAEVAKEMLAENNFDIDYHSRESRRRWEQTKFFRLYQIARSTGQKPEAVFAKEGLSL